MSAGVGSGEHHVDLKPIKNSEAEDALRAAETVSQLAMQQISQEVELSQELLVYPEGDVDAVKITERDVEGLQPERFLSDNIVDFYIRFLERGLSPEYRIRSYFFNSFFFTALLQSTASTAIDPCKVDYERLRKWTNEVNLFAKDYVFIPIIKSSHWSLVIICHLNNLTRPPGEMMRSPCVVHLDPIEGQHESFEGFIRSYVLQAWMERFGISSNGDQLLALCQMKYVEAKVPRQDNSHDCGLYVLNYIEAFLLESTSSDFSFTSSERGPHFLSPHFVQEVLGKRKHIQNLIHKLSGVSQKRARKRKAIEEVLQSTQNLRFLLLHEDNFEACIKDVHTVSPTVFNGQGSEIVYASTHEDALVAHDGQSTFDGLQIGPTEYEDKCEILSPKQHYAEPKVQTGGPTHLNGSMSVTKHVFIHEDASGISRLDHEPLDGPELPHVEYQRGGESFPDMLQHPALEEVPCVDLSEVREGKNKRGRNMTKEETWVLLSCMVEGGRFYKGSGGRTNWNLISEEIGEKLGSLPSADQCRLRFDTLLKAYNAYKKHCMKTGKTFSEITEEERLDLKLATTLSEEMYTTMDEIRSKANKSQKCMKLSSNVRNDLHPLSSLDALAPNPPPISRGMSFEDEAVELDGSCGTVENALRKVVPASVFSSFNEDLQSTLFNLVHECSWGSEVKNRIDFNLDEVCQRLAIVQDREPSEILNYVFKLWKLDVVNVHNMVLKEGNDPAHIELWKYKTWYLELGLYEKISEEVLCKNPQFQTYCYSFPIEQSSMQYIRVLELWECHELEHLDLREFPSLRSLAIWSCRQFSSVTGWEVATSLASLEISDCDAFLDFPEVRYLFALREIVLGGWKSNKSTIPCHLSQISQCAKLRRLEISHEESFSEIADLENLKELKFLEYLSLHACTFSSIRGLSGLQALTTLCLWNCRGFTRVPELGCLTGLTRLDMFGSSVENIQGVEELHLLTSLVLHDCWSLKELPFLGQLKDLVYLDLRGTGVKEIPGRESLTNCKIFKGDLFLGILTNC